jgi:hypothetical protein
MARDEVLPGWNWKRITQARKLLLQEGLIQLVCDRKLTAHGCLPAQYRFAANWGDAQKGGGGPVTLPPKMGGWL